MDNSISIILLAKKLDPYVTYMSIGQDHVSNCCTLYNASINVSILNIDKFSEKGRGETRACIHNN
jgi:hypothetical protein